MMSMMVSMMMSVMMRVGPLLISVVTVVAFVAFMMLFRVAFFVMSVGDDAKDSEEQNCLHVGLVSRSVHSVDRQYR